MNDRKEKSGFLKWSSLAYFLLSPIPVVLSVLLLLLVEQIGQDIPEHQERADVLVGLWGSIVPMGASVVLGIVGAVLWAVKRNQSGFYTSLPLLIASLVALAPCIALVFLFLLAWVG